MHRDQFDETSNPGYCLDMQKLIPRGAEWQLMQDSVRMQMRQILSDDYRYKTTL